MTSEQIDRFLAVMERLSAVAERWCDVEYPKRDENPEEIEVYSRGDSPEPQSPEEYNRFTAQAPGRFEASFKEKAF